MRNFFYVEKLLCEFSIDHFFSNNASCHARPKSRDVVVVNFYGMLKKEIRDLSVLFQNPFKMDRNEWMNKFQVRFITNKRYHAVYKKGVVDLTMDFCEGFRNPLMKFNPIFKFYFEVVKKNTKHFHQCPMKVLIMFLKFPWLILNLNFHVHRRMKK
jgi:hypothetical protein